MPRMKVARPQPTGAANARGIAFLTGLNLETVDPGCHGNEVAAGNAGQWEEHSSVYQKRDGQVFS